MDRAGRVAEHVHPSPVHSIVRLHRLDDVPQQKRAIVAHAPPVADDGIWPGEDDAFLLRHRLPMLDQDLSVAARTVQENQQRRRLLLGLVGHEQVVRPFRALRGDGLFGDLLGGVRARGEGKDHDS